jgi:hypothetical protein
MLTRFATFPIVSTSFLGLRGFATKTAVAPNATTTAAAAAAAAATSRPSSKADILQDPAIRAKALQKRKESMAAKREFKISIKTSMITVEDAIYRAFNEPVLKKLRFSQFVRSLPGVGAKGLQEIVDEVGAAPDTPLKDLTELQCSALKNIVKVRAQTPSKK